MASQAAALKYASYGAEATAFGGYYDTSPRKTAIPAPAGRPERYAPPREAPVAKPAARTAARPKYAYGVALFSVFGFAFAAVLLLFVVLAHINYIEVTNDTVQLEAHLSALAKEGKMLEIAYEQAFDMDAVENYALYVLGMVKPDAEQVAVVDAIPRDKAVILSDADDDGGGGLGSFLSSLLEYLK